MRIEYTLEKIDFLRLHFYAASKSIILIRKRILSGISILSLILSILLLILGYLDSALVFIVSGIILYFFYPYIIKKRSFLYFTKKIEKKTNTIVAKIIEKRIDSNYKNTYGKLINLEFEPDYIVIVNYVGEKRLRIKEISEINEINDYIFIKFSDGTIFILPKERITNKNELNSVLTKIVSDLNVTHNVDLSQQ
ncbi:YcxB-like protein [Flavobacterium sp. 9]|uniref:YcxB family protein n=1 Tax=Flavobacterium sp. 9 TaxID=2035198 RepID=UPI000C192649|nr:YcxB family protein [Flavobacterium sp. 9]PIF30131.1 YcxB-like protein [Flavobacterium sp. 9]